jgi:hypothetical protein
MFKISAEPIVFPSIYCRIQQANAFGLGNVFQGNNWKNDFSGWRRYSEVCYMKTTHLILKEESKKVYGHLFRSLLQKVSRNFSFSNFAIRNLKVIFKQIRKSEDTLVWKIGVYKHNSITVWSWKLFLSVLKALRQEKINVYPADSVKVYF